MVINLRERKTYPLIFYDAIFPYSDKLQKMHLLPPTFYEYYSEITVSSLAESTTAYTVL